MSVLKYWDIAEVPRSVSNDCSVAMKALLIEKKMQAFDGFERHKKPHTSNNFRWDPMAQQEINYWLMKTSLWVISNDLSESGISIQTREIANMGEEKPLTNQGNRIEKNKGSLINCECKDSTNYI